MKKIFGIILFFLMGIGPVFYVSAGSFNGFKAYPNPVRLDQNQTGVTFKNVPGKVRLRVYSSRGQVVLDQNRDQGTQFIWNLTNDAGSIVAPGIYIYLITDSAGESVRGKLAVLR